MWRRLCEAAAPRDEVPGRSRQAAGQITVPRNQWAYRHVTPTPRGPKSQPASPGHRPKAGRGGQKLGSLSQRAAAPQAGRPLSPADPAKYLVWTRQFWIWCHQMAKFRLHLMSKLLRVLSCFQTEQKSH